MGMFDSVWVSCPCGKDVEFQSKAGACCLRDYTFPDAPQEVLADINGQTRECSCGISLTVRTQILAYVENS